MMLTRVNPMPPRLGRVLAIALVAGLFVGGIQSWPPVASSPLARWFFDLTQQVAALDAPANPRIVLVGIDEASVEAVAEPIALWHRPLGRAFTALARGRPQAVGIDIALPDRSFDAIAPGGDAALIVGIEALNQSTRAVYALAIQADGRVRGIHGPLVAAMGSERLGLAYWPLDADGVVRRYAPLSSGGQTAPLLVERLAAAHGHVGQMQAGWVDFAATAPFDYVPFADVLKHEHDPAWLLQRFAGKTVLLGAVLPFEDEYRQPVNPARWRQGGQGQLAPGLTLYAKALAALDAHQAYLAPARVGSAVVASLLVAVALLLPLRAAPVVWMAAALLAMAAAIAARGHGAWLDASLPIVLSAALLLARTAYAAWANWRTRQSLTRAFGGYVSPELLEEILQGRLDPFTPRHSELAFLFVDLRDSTPLTRELTAPRMVALLNQFFAGVTSAIHAQHGTVDNFRGDGVLAYFGAPRMLANPSQAALDAALAIDAARAAGTLGRADLRLSMGIAVGAAVTANIGGAARNNYTAIGEPVNLAARLQEACKRENAVVVLDATAMSRAAIPLGYTSRALHEDVRGVGPVEAVVVTRGDT